ncbi:hypothetical protein [Microbacterium sp. KR10-403]|uniref:HAAS signaling domain-containing protein n=1 Tax=Microbacterium sp. KR10-403 TaxID=3158581 RepID=UPI0032E48D62
MMIDEAESREDAQVKDYLATVNRELAGVPATTREAILDDLRAHIADARESGRSAAQVLGALGTARAVSRASLAELGDGDNESAAGRARTILLSAGVVGAVVIGVVVAFLMMNDVYPPDQGEAAADQPGLNPGYPLLAVIPVLLLGVPFVIPARSRGRATMIIAILMTVFFAGVPLVQNILALFDVGFGNELLWRVYLYLPIVLLVWFAVGIPRSLSRGGDPARSLGLRITGAVVFGLAAVALLPALRPLGEGDAAVLLTISVGLVVTVGSAVLFALGRGYTILAAAWVLALVVGMTRASMVWDLYWTIGASAVALCLAGVAAAFARRRTGDPAV